MGRVYLAQRDIETVAVKILSTAGARRPEHRTRFEREINSLKRIRSPFVAPIIDADIQLNESWLAVRYIDGVNLAERLSNGRALTDAQWLETLISLLVALASVHDLEIIHRDVKPANILMSSFGPQIIDFGIAQSPDQTSLTHTRSFVGSAAWLAPEVFSEETLTTQVDVFGLASTMVFAATGKTPWGDIATHEGLVMERVRTQAPILDQVSRRFHPLLSRMFEKDPLSRLTARQALSEAVALANDEVLSRVRSWVQIASREDRTIPEDITTLLDLREQEANDKLLAEAKATAATIVEDARRQASKDARAIINEAQKQGVLLSDRAQRELEAQRQRLDRESERLGKEAADTLAKATAKAAKIVDQANKTARRVLPKGSPDTTGQSDREAPKSGRWRIALTIVATAVVASTATSAAWWWGPSLPLVETNTGSEIDVDPSDDRALARPLTTPCQGMLCDVALRVSSAATDSLVITGWSRGMPVQADEPLAIEITLASGQPIEVGSCGREVEVPFLATSNFQRVWSVECTGVLGIEDWPQKQGSTAMAGANAYTIRAGPDHSNRYTSEWGQSVFQLDQTVSKVRGSGLASWPEIADVIFPNGEFDQNTPQKLLASEDRVLTTTGIEVFWWGGHLGDGSARDLFEDKYSYVSDDNVLVRDDCVSGELSATGLPGWSKVTVLNEASDAERFDTWERVSVATWSPGCGEGQVARRYTVNLDPFSQSTTCTVVRFTNTGTQDASQFTDLDERWCVVTAADANASGKTTPAAGAKS
jgi:F0F1-type ATP synthase membrane subunit b/b'